MEASPDHQFFQASPGAYCNAAHFTPEKPKPVDYFPIEDLLDFPTDDSVAAADGLEAAATNPVVAAGNSSTDSASTVTAVDSCNSSLCGGGEPHFTREMVHSRSFADTQFSNDLCVPYDDMAELEWLSNFVEESFSSEDLQKLQLISGVKARPDPASEANHQFQAEANRNNPIFNPDMSVPGKARTKRSRAAPCNWTSRLLVLSPTTPAVVASSESESDITSSTVKKATVKAPSKKKEVVYDDNGVPMNNRDGRKCLHCATDKTPQWRTGPMGPKTLCNACGVRYKSGRLVPEYRPAASPTFVLTKHSNSHRKVLELRRQKEMQRAHHQQQQFIHHQNMMFDVPGGDDYLIHQHIGPDYRQLI